jgi:protoheme IX farnesyltransferase
LPASLVPALVGLSGWIYPATAVVLGSALLWLAVRFAATRSDRAARQLFVGSIIYLPLIWVAMIYGKR